MILCNECAAREYLNNPSRDRHPVSVGITKCEQCSRIRFCAEYKEGMEECAIERDHE